MAGLKSRLRDELGRYFVHDLEDMNKHIGRGAYGEVVEMKMGDEIVAVKKLHGALLGAQDSQYIVSRFEEECKRLSSINHPNIVKFLGISFEEGSDCPMLVMEYLPESLSSYIDKYNENKCTPAEEVRRSIMLDVAEGLKYLKELEQPMIHRDLTANNILLTSDHRAKLSDFGVSKLMCTDRLSMSKAPGNAAHMPPEALTDKQRYSGTKEEGLKFDIFSFGNVLLNLITGKFPQPDSEYEGMKRITEVKRRWKYIEDIRESNEKDIIIRCLNNIPNNRPTIDELVQFFKGETSNEDDLKIDEGDPEFVEQPTHEVTCPICASLLDDPCQSKCCGKHFCKPCITRLKKENCPLCRDPDFSVSLDKHFGRQVLSLQVMCYYNKRGCPWTGELRELKRHVDNTCNKNKFWCKYCLKEFSKTAFSLHIDVCEDTPQSCPNKCAREVKRRLLKRHLEQQCHLRVIKEGPIAHAANQSIQLVPVAFSMTKFSQYVETGDIWYSPPFYTARNGYKVHLRVEVNRYVKEHISVMLCILKSTHDNTLCWPLHAEVKVGLYDWKSRTPVYTKVLYAVGDAFCLQNATDIPASWGSGCFDFISLNTLTSHEKNVQYIRYDCLNFCIQRVTIQNIRPLPVLPTWAGNNAFVVPTLSFLKQKGISLFCGPPIYSSNQEGYKLCPQVHPCGQDAGNGSHISISCSLMKGECDDRLQWPMVADITLIMLNWREDKSHKVFTFTFSQVLDKSMVSKVTNEGMAEKSLSVPKFTAYSSLPYNPNTSTEYLKQDCLLFRVKSVVAYSDKALVSRLPVWVDQVKDSPCPCFTLTEYTRQKINNGFWYSNPFYSHHYGYKMQLKVHISNGPSVGLYVVLMMGPNDDHLQWPFCADIFLELVNWRSDSTHHSTVLRLSPKCKSNVCNRVTDSERNNGLGYEHFITHDALAYSAATGVEYLQEDCLHFRVKEIILYSTPPAIYAPSWQGRAFSPYFQFTVNSFKKRKEGDCEYLSPIFYSHQNGYKMQIEVMPNKNGFVSVFAKLLKSEYDATLSWPFTGNVKVELLNHIRDSDHHSYNIAFHERVDASISSQVQGNENSCLGKGQFISQDSLVHDQSKHTEYLKSDCLCFQVKVAAYTKTNRLPRWLNPNTPNFSFTITDISERIQMDNYYYSNPFLISKYKMCLKVSFNEYKVSEKANYVSILVCLLKGDDDNTLEWPFCGEIVIEVLNWNSSHGHVRKILALNRPELSSHERVIQETPSPEGFGISYFVPVSTLFSQYIDNGCMCVRVGDAAIYSNPFILKQPRWQQSQRATGFFTFTVTNISWRTENDRTFYSKPFYTHRNGYKMRLEIDFSHNKAPNGYLSIFARLMVGDYDSSLKWPMNVTLFLQVLNWVQNSSHIVNPIKFGGVPISGRKRVSKQDEGKRASYGIDEFSSPGELYKNSRYVQYIQDDCIRVRISTVAVLSKKWFF